MSFLCGSACQDRKNKEAEAKLIAAQSQADALRSLTSSSGYTWYIVAAVVVAIGLFIYLKFFNKK